MPRDYYEVLGVQRDANKQDIKRAFRQLARQYHPDVSEHSDAEDRFKEINEAYEVLNDDEKRARYDRFGHAGVGGNGFNGAGGFTGFSGFEEIFEDFFNNFAGGGRTRGTRQRQRARTGGDRRVDVNITFEEAVFGIEKEVEFERLDVCDVCKGEGAEPGLSTNPPDPALLLTPFSPRPDRS